MFHKSNNSATTCKVFLGSAALESLIGAIALKQAPALSALYYCAASQVYAAAHQVVRSKEDAEEIVCDVFMYVWEHALKYDCQRGTVMAWLTTITRNRAIDLVRKRHPDLSWDTESPLWIDRLTADSESAEQQCVRWQNGCALHRQLAMLSPLRRQLVRLAFFEGMTHQEIVDRLGIPHGTVKSHIRRALRTIKELDQFWRSGATVRR